MTNSLSSLSREVAVIPSQTALLIVDMQNYCCHPMGSGHEDNNDSTSSKYTNDYYVSRLPIVVKNIALLIRECRKSKIEVMYTVIEAMTKVRKDFGNSFSLCSVITVHCRPDVILQIIFSLLLIIIIITAIIDNIIIPRTVEIILWVSYDRMYYAMLNHYIIIFIL